MKKRFLAVLVTIAMVLALVPALVSCKPPERFTFDVSFVKDLKTSDLKNAAGLGVGKETIASASQGGGATASLNGGIFASKGGIFASAG